MGIQAEVENEGGDKLFKEIYEKLKEALMGVFPVTLIILIVNSFSPMTRSDFTAFFVGAILLIMGLALYNFGSGIIFNSILFNDNWITYR